jgi:hypothetical protein
MLPGLTNGASSQVTVRRLFSCPLLLTRGRRGSFLQTPSTINLISYLPGYNLRFKEKVPLSDLSILLWLVQPSKDPVNRTSEAGLDHTI